MFVIALRNPLRFGSLVVAALLLSAASLAGLTPQAQPGARPVQPIEPPQKVSPELRAAGQMFLENRGQWNPVALFASRTPGVDTWVTREGLRYDFYTVVDTGNGGTIRRGHVVQMDFDGMIGSRTPEGIGAARYGTDFINWSDQVRVRGAKRYAEAYVRNLYPGIDLRTYVEQSQPRYDLIVAPGADPSLVRMTFKGHEGLRIASDDSIAITTSLGAVYHRGLMAFQGNGQARREVPVRFRVLDHNTVGLMVGAYDRSKPLVIDPLVYGTLFGGDGGADVVTAAASDNAGNVYVAGATVAYDFPITIGPYGVNLKDTRDAYLSSLQGDAYDVSYVAYVGGVGDDYAKFLQIDQYGSVWMAGETTSIRYPRDIEQTIDVVPENGKAPSFGNYQLRYGGATTELIPFNASAATVQNELNNLPTAPPGGFTVTAENATLPGADPGPYNRYRIIAIGRELTPVTIRSRMNPYRAVRDEFDPFTQSIEMQYPANQYWFAPNSGNFTITYTPLSGNAETTGPIPYNANGAMVDAALRALAAIPDADNPPNFTLTCMGGPLPFVPVRVTFGGTDAAWSAPQNLLTINNAPTAPPGVIPMGSGQYQISNGPLKGFFTRFAASASTILDPITNELAAFSGAVLDAPSIDKRGVTGFQIRQVATATGPVEIVMAGNTTGPQPGIVGPKPGGRDGFVLRWTYNQGAKTLSAVDGTRSKYVGGTGTDYLTGMALDADGSIYVAGSVEYDGNLVTGPTSPVFQTTTGVFANGNLLRNSDAYVRKYDTSGNIQYSALIGGSGYDEADGLAVDALGNAYLTGVARSFNFPRTPGSFGQQFSPSPVVFVTKVNPNASQILYSTNLNSSGWVTPRGIVVDSRGNAYVGGIVGFTKVGPPDAPTIPSRIVTTPIAPAVPGQEAAIDATYTAGDRQWVPAAGPPRGPSSTTEGFLTVLNSTATGLLYSSYIGQDGSEDVLGLNVDRSGSVWVSGFTTFAAVNFPVDPGLGPPQPRVMDNTLANFPPVAGGTPGLPDGYLSPLAFKHTPDITGDGFVFKMRVALPILQSVSLSPDQIAGGLGAFSTGTVSLRSPAPAGGTQVTVRVLNPSVARLSRIGGPTSLRLTIPAGATTATFEVYSNRVLVPSFCDIRAELDSDYLISRLNVRPWLDAFSLSSDSVSGGNTTTGTVTLFQPAPAGGVNVLLSTDTPNLVSFPLATITVPAGQQSITFDIDTVGVAANVTVNITTTVEGVGMTEPLTLLPASVIGVTFNPTSVNGGEDSIATVRLDGKAVAGAVMTLTQSGTPVNFPPSITLSDGDTEVSFTVNTYAVTGSNTSATITATLNGSSQSGTLLLESNQIQTLTLSATSVLGGSQVTGQVNLLRPAGASGFSIPIDNSNPTAGDVVPTTVVIAPGQTVGTFVVNTKGVAVTQTMTIRALKPGYFNASATLEVRALSFTLSLDPVTVTGSQSSTGTIQLAAGEVAPAGGVTFSLSSSNPAAASVPATVLVPAGQSKATFTVTTSAVTTDQNVLITATAAGGAQASRTLTVQAPGIISLSVQPSTPTGGAVATGTLVLNVAAPSGGLVISLSSSNTSAATVPASVTVPAGQTSASFPVTTYPVASDTSATITATRGSVMKSTTITVKVSVLLSLTLSPNVVRSGDTSLATLTSDQPAPAGGLVVTLTTDRPDLITMPATVLLPAGATSVQFNVVAGNVSRRVAPLITATLNSQSVSARLWIDPKP